MTRLLVLLPASGPDWALRRLAEKSLMAERERGHAIFTRVLDGPASHGRKLDYGKTLAPDYDLVVTMDTDCVVFPGWAEWITSTLAEPLIGACGAPRVDFPLLHPSMLAMRSALYVKAPSFEATEGRDTGVTVCQWLEGQGLYLHGAPMVRHPGGWWAFGTLWWHLGSGTASAWPGWPVHLGRLVKAALGSHPHRKAVARVRRRQRFIREATRRIR